jgi:hypothetical protein
VSVFACIDEFSSESTGIVFIQYRNALGGVKQRGIGYRIAFSSGTKRFDCCERSLVTAVLQVTGVTVVTVVAAMTVVEVVTVVAAMTVVAVTMATWSQPVVTSVTVVAAMTWRRGQW